MAEDFTWESVSKEEYQEEETVHIKLENIGENNFETTCPSFHVNQFNFWNYL